MITEARKQILAKVAERSGTPSFVYFIADMEQRAKELKDAFEGAFSLSFAMKCNPHPAIVRKLQGLTEALDVSSGGELRIALALGYRPDRISFTGPAKQRADLELAVHHAIGEVVVESVREARELSQLAQRQGKTQSILIRIAPRRVPKGFGVNMAGRPCQFGIDEEDLDAAVHSIKNLPGLALQGFHIYSGTQCLKPAAIAENYGILMDIYRGVCSAHKLRPRKLIFGSGFGIPYHDEDVPLRAQDVADRVLSELQAFKREGPFAEVELILEMGRYLVGEAGIYLTRVVNRKHSRGTEIATFDGGMHHHLGAAGHLGMVLHRNYRLFQLSPHPEATRVQHDLYGPLCTTIDVLGRGVEMPELQVGDVIGIHCSGAYGVTASPAHFISHDLPAEVMVEGPESAPVVTEISSRRRHGDPDSVSGAM